MARPGEADDRDRGKRGERDKRADPARRSSERGNGDERQCDGADDQRVPAWGIGQQRRPYRTGPPRRSLTRCMSVENDVGGLITSPGYSTPDTRAARASLIGYGPIGDEGFFARLRTGRWRCEERMTNLDGMLQRLSDLPTDPRLAAIDDAVIDALARRRTHGAPLPGSVFAIAAGLALTIGLVTSLIPASESHAATINPLGASPALAPSTLLGTD